MRSDLALADMYRDDSEGEVLPRNSAPAGALHDRGEALLIRPGLDRLGEIDVSLWI